MAVGLAPVRRFRAECTHGTLLLMYILGHSLY